MQEKSKNVDLEIVSVTSNEAVPAVEVEQVKEKKGWTLFRSNKSKSEENAKREIFSDEEPNVTVKNIKLNADASKKVDESKKTEEDVVVVPKRRWYQWFGKRSQKKNKKPEVDPGDDSAANKNEVPSAEDSNDKASEISKTEDTESVILTPNAESIDNEGFGALSDNAESVNKEEPVASSANGEATDKEQPEAASVEPPNSEPEKRKRLTLNFFRRSTKKNKKTEKAPMTETIVEEAEKVSPTETIVEEISIHTLEEKVETTEEVATDDVKRKRFTLKTFFRRSTKEDKKSPESDPNAQTAENGDEKVVEINETGTESEKTEENRNSGGTNAKEVPTEETKIECSDKNDETCNVVVAKDEQLQTGDVPKDDKQIEKPELPIGDNANVGDVQNVDEPNIDENLPNDDNAEKPVNLNAETPMKEVEQK